MPHDGALDWWEWTKVYWLVVAVLAGCVAAAISEIAPDLCE